MSGWLTKMKPKKNRRKNDDMNKMQRGDSMMDDDSDPDDNYYDGMDYQQQQQQNNKAKRKKYQNQNKTNNNNNQHMNGHQSDKLYVGDKILLVNKRSGKVTSLGPKRDKDGIWVRVAMDNADDDSSASSKAIWVPINRVNRILSKKNRLFDFTIDDRVVDRNKGVAGTIKYVGPTHFHKGVWFGVAYDSPKGKHNGTVREKFYFLCDSKHGAMIPYKRLEAEPTTTKQTKRRKEKKRSVSNGFDKNGHSNAEYEKNSASKHNNKHAKTQSEGGLGNNINKQLQLDQLQQERANANAQTNNNNHSSSNSNEEYEYLEDDMPPSSDSEVKMYMALKSPSTTTPSPQRKKQNMKPREKRPFQGWKKLVHGQMPFDLDDAKADALRSPPTPYQLETHEVTVTILNAFMKQIKQFHGCEKDLYESQLPSITEVNKERREEIFIEKLYLCQSKCDFFDTRDEMIELIEKKERMLLELSEFIARHVWFKESLYEKCLCTVANNLFRALPFQDRPPALSFFNDEVFDKDTNFEDPAWRHLKLVYDLTWRVINTPQVTATMMEKHMTGKFLGNLVELFASEDHRERAYLMMILHKIYGRCLKLRPYIIQIMSGYFYRMIYADEFQHVNGIIELLQIICAIIPGLTVPVKDSWQSFVRNILVPLHKIRGLKKFWEQLTQCCVNYVAKDEDGGAVILGGLLKFWPQQSPQKEEIFIMEVVNIINVLITHQHGFSYDNYKEVLVCAANKLTQCMLSTRQPVAERAIAAWKEQSMQRLVDYDRKAFLPKLCEAFYRNREHPNAALKQSSSAVEKIYRSKDSAYWKKMQQYLAKKDKKETAVAKAISDAQMKNKDPYDIVKAKHLKDSAKHKRPKPLTNAEKSAKRDHFWKKVNKVANINRQKFERQHLQNYDSNSSSSLEPPNLSGN